jgi:hypothetical protein
MPRVTYVKKARKDHPAGGIKKGDSYYWWKFRYGGKRFSRTPPRQSQLTNSDKLSRVYAAQESVEDAMGESALPDDWRGAVEDAANEVREVGEEYQESCDNIRDQFTDSPTADECEEKAEACESVASEMDDIDFDSLPDKPEDGDEPEEPEDPGEEPQEDDKNTWGDHESYEEAKAEWDLKSDEYDEYRTALEEYENSVEEYDNAVGDLRDAIEGLDWCIG